MSLAELGRVRRGAPESKEAVRSPRRSITRSAVVCARLGAGHGSAASRATGRRAIRCSSAALDAVPDAERRRSAVRCGRLVRWALRTRCRATRARRCRCCEDERSSARRPRRIHVGYRGCVCHSLGEAYLLAGRLDEARRPGRPQRSTLVRGSTGTRPRGVGPPPPRRDRRASATAPTSRAAEAHYREALALAEPSSACAPSSPTATSASASSTAAPATSAKAQEHLTTATTMYREMGMTFWLEKADAELGGVER